MQIYKCPIRTYQLVRKLKMPKILPKYKTLPACGGVYNIHLKEITIVQALRALSSFAVRSDDGARYSQMLVGIRNACSVRSRPDSGLEYCHISS